MPATVVDPLAEPAPVPAALAVLAVLAEPNRARIIELLRHGEHCVCDVGTSLSMSTALVSHHLRALRAAGLLRERRAGRWVYYALDPDGLARVRDQIAELLTPGPDAATTCHVSTCDAGPAGGRHEGHDLLVLGEGGA